jgi:2,5-dihydroxypyridine 5,6-dioxygenase
MSVSDIDLIHAWKQVLTLSRLEAGQTVTVLTGADTHPQTLRCAIAASSDMGARVNRLDLPPVNAEKSLSRDSLAYLGTTPLTGNPAAIAALKASDLVLDLMTLLFSPEQHEILQTGTKILLAVEPPEVLCRLVPTEGDRARVQAASKRIEAAGQMHITSAAGTDLRCRLGSFPAICEYGFVDQPGRWDHWPSGFVLTWPDEGESNGRVVLDRGDILLPMKDYVTEPIELVIEKGYVTRISGGLQADILKEYMASYEDPEAYAVSHIGWGLQPRAHWSMLAHYDKETHIGMDARAFEGNFLWSMGPNNEAGGSRTTACHIDIPMRHCTVALDGKPTVINGVVQDEEGLARAAKGPSKERTSHDHGNHQRTERPHRGRAGRHLRLRAPGLRHAAAAEGALRPAHHRLRQRLCRPGRLRRRQHPRSHRPDAAAAGPCARARLARGAQPHRVLGRRCRPQHLLPEGARHADAEGRQPPAPSCPSWPRPPANTWCARARPRPSSAPCWRPGWPSAACRPWWWPAA